MDITKIDEVFFQELSEMFASKGVALRSVNTDWMNLTAGRADSRYVEVRHELVIELEQVKKR